MLVDLARLEYEYYECRPDPDSPDQMVSFGTSGHRGSSFRGSFTQKLIFSRSPRRSATPGKPEAPMVRSIWARTRTHVRAGAAHRARSPGGKRPSRRSFSARRRNPDAGDLAGKSSSATAVAPAGSPMASSSLLLTTRRTRRVPKNNPTHGGPADTDITEWIEARATKFYDVAMLDASGRPSPRPSMRTRRRRRHSLLDATICAMSLTWKSFAVPDFSLAVDSVGRRRGALLGNRSTRSMGWISSSIRGRTRPSRS